MDYSCLKKVITKQFSNMTQKCTEKTWNYFKPVFERFEHLKHMSCNIIITCVKMTINLDFSKSVSTLMIHLRRRLRCSFMFKINLHFNNPVMKNSKIKKLILKFRKQLKFQVRKICLFRSLEDFKLVLFVKA